MDLPFGQFAIDIVLFITVSNVIYKGRFSPGFSNSKTVAEILCAVISAPICLFWNYGSCCQHHWDQRSIYNIEAYSAPELVHFASALYSRTYIASDCLWDWRVFSTVKLWAAGCYSEVPTIPCTYIVWEEKYHIMELCNGDPLPNTYTT